MKFKEFYNNSLDSTINEAFEEIKKYFDKESKKFASKGDSYYRHGSKWAKLTKHDSGEYKGRYSVYWGWKGNTKATDYRVNMDKDSAEIRIKHYLEDQ